MIVDEVSSIEKDIKRHETSLGNQKATCSKRLVDVDECKDRLALANLNVSKTSRIRDSLQDEISKLENNQLATLRDCKLGGTNIPLLEGSLDNIPLEEVILEESTNRNNDVQDADGDVDMVDADSTFGSKDKLHGIVVEYESLSETYMNDSDDSVEARFLENIKTLSNDIEKMVINVRAEEKLAEITEKLKEVQEEFNEVKKRAKATKENFDAVKKKDMNCLTRRMLTFRSRLIPFTRILQEEKHAQWVDLPFLTWKTKRNLIWKVSPITRCLQTNDSAKWNCCQEERKLLRRWHCCLQFIRTSHPHSSFWMKLMQHWIMLMCLVFLIT